MIRNRCFDMGSVQSDKMNTNKMWMDANNVEFMDMGMNGCNMPPIYECPQERCCHREIHHEVKHIVPVNTKIMNHHIIHHTYVPMYTCCEEDTCCNVYDKKCGRM